MAQFRFSVSVVSRKEGKSSLAMAAYRSGECLRDFVTGKARNYARRRGVVYAEIVLPEDAPEWAKDRAEFWNRNEATDRRYNAVVARELQLNLPHELDADQRRDLVVKFARHMVDRFGFPVDCAIHLPNPAGDERNHHAHFLFAERPFDATRKTGFGTKTRVWDAIARKRSKQQPVVEEMRRVWAEMENAALAAARIKTGSGEPMRVDHRSYERQGIERPPGVKQWHHGPALTAMRRRQQAEAAQTKEQRQADPPARRLLHGLKVRRISYKPQPPPEIVADRRQIGPPRRFIEYQRCGFS